MTVTMDNTLGAVLMQFRERENYTRAQLGRISGLDPTFLKRIEQNEREPSRETLDELASSLNLTAAEHDLILIMRGFVPSRLESLNVYPELTILNNTLNRLHAQGSGHIVSIQRLLTQVNKLAEALHDRGE